MCASFVDLHCYMEYGLSHNYFQVILSGLTLKINFWDGYYCRNGFPAQFFSPSYWNHFAFSGYPFLKFHSCCPNFSYQLLIRLVIGLRNAIVCVIYATTKLCCLFILVFIEFRYVVGSNSFQLNQFCS